MTQESVRLNADLVLFSQQFQKGIDDANRAMFKMQGQAANTDKAIKRTSTTLNQTSRSQRAFNMQVNQGAIQAADFFQQIEMGTSITRAGGQQLSGFASVLSGPWAIALQAAAVGLLLFGSSLTRTNEEAESYKKRLQEIIDATNKLTAENDRLLRGVSTRVFAVEEEIAAQRELLRINEATEVTTLNTVRLRSERIEILRRIRTLEAELLELNQQETRQLEIQESEYDLIGEAVDGLIDANQALDQILQRQIEKHAAALGLLQAQGRQIISNVRNNPDFYDPRSEGRGAGDPNYRPPPLGLPPVVIPPLATFGDGSGAGGGRSGPVDDTLEKIERMNEELREATKQADQFGKSMQDSIAGLAGSALDGFIDGLVEGELRFKDFARSILQELAKILIRAAMVQAIMSAFGGVPGSPAGFGQSVIQQLAGIGRITPFAKGGVVSGPTMFPMSNGMGMMGEKGPEAIVPLKRHGGNLGVGASPVYVQVDNYSGQNVNVSRDGDLVRIAVGQATQAVRTEFADSMARGQGTYARAIEGNYSARRKAT